jgi:cytidine deaminase
MADPDEAVLAEMLARARAASERAYCPYSEFPVGACVLTTDGELFDGCNVENASYGLTICAERGAVCRWSPRGKQAIRAVVICTPAPRPAARAGRADR